MYDYQLVLDDLKSRDLLRKEKTLSSFQDVKVKYEDRIIHLMGSNNYLSLNNHPQLNEFTKSIIDEYGTGSGGSRLTTGSSYWHKKLEEKLSVFKNTEDTLVFSSGYMANIGVITALANKESHIFSDRNNHASIVDGILLSKASFTRYKHLSTSDLERHLVNSKSINKIVITDSVFSMDGHIAKLKDIIRLCKKYDALLILDDAHGLGVLGKHGRGLSEHLNIKEGIDLTIGTLSKAIPSTGGYITGSKLLIDVIRNKARSYIFSTSLPPSVMATNFKSLELIETSIDRRISLNNKTNYFINLLNQGGFNIEKQFTPIISIVIGSSETTVKIQNLLLEEDDIYIPGIRPPTVKKGTSRLRASINFMHSYDSLDYIASKIIHHCKNFNII